MELGSRPRSPATSLALKRSRAPNASAQHFKPTIEQQRGVSILLVSGGFMLVGLSPSVRSGNTG